MFLFKVEERYMITDRGLTLMPGVGNKKVRMGDRIKLVRPDQSVIETKIVGITFSINRDILVESHLTKDDVPIGTEVWLTE